MIFSRYGVSGLAAATSILIVGPAAAQTLYNAEISGTTISPSGVSTPITSISDRFSSVPVNASAAAEDWSVEATAKSTSGGRVSAQVIMSPLDTTMTHAGKLSADSSLSYTLTLDPKVVAATTESDGLVPVTIGALGGIQWNQDGTALAEFLVRSETTGAVVIDEQLNKTSRPGLNFIADSTNFFLNETFGLNPNDSYQVFMSASAFGDSSFFSDDKGMEITASIDPTFTVAGAFASQWSIEGVPEDPSTGPGPGVPEPATWAMLIAGFGLAGASLRRRRAAVA